MNKKTFQILSLIISIISLIYLVLSYYGLIRYFQLHFVNIENYIEKYKNLSKTQSNRVIVAFAAEADQLKNLKPFLNSILDQTVKIDDIAVIIPNKDRDKIPKEFKKILSVIGCDKDYDDAHNIICPVLREPDSHTKIIVVEPNMVYGKDFVESMVESSDKSPDKIIFGDSSKNIKYGILIKPKFFDEKISDYIKGKGYNLWLNECSKCEGQDCIEYSQIYKMF